MLLALIVRILPTGSHHAGQIEGLFVDADRVSGHRLALNIVDIRVHACRNGHDQCDADNADGSCECRKERAALLGTQIVEAQCQRRAERHGCAAHGLAHGSSGRFVLNWFERVGVGTNHTVLELHNARGILVGQFGVVCHHHHKTVFGDLFEQIHDLHGSVGIKRTGWLVGEHDIRIVHQRACNGHALHLTAGKLVRLFVDVFAQTHLFKRLARTFSTLRTRYARNGQGKFHIRQNGLMGNEIVALEYETDGVVAIGVPIAAFVLFGGNAVDYQIAGIIVVKSADDIKQCGFAGSRRTENGHEFVVTQV